MQTICDILFLSYEIEWMQTSHVPWDCPSTFHAECIAIKCMKDHALEIYWNINSTTTMCSMIPSSVTGCLAAWMGGEQFSNSNNFDILCGKRFFSFSLSHASTFPLLPIFFLLCLQFDLSIGVHIKHISLHTSTMVYN